jgi:hypothetical protein
LEPPLKIGYKMAVNEMAAFAKTFSKIWEQLPNAGQKLPFH